MLTRNRNRQANSIVSNDTEESLPSDKCRICLKDGYIPIFGDDDISKEIMEFGCVEVSNLDNLPQHLCNACHSLLEAAILFRTTAQKSDKILKIADNIKQQSVDSNEDENESDYSADQNCNSMDRQCDTDSESYIKKEYLEYNDSSEAESINGCESYSENEKLQYIQSEFDEDQIVNDKKNTQVQMLNVKEEDCKNNDVDNELVMIIVSDNDKTNKTFLEKPDNEKKLNTNPDHQKCDICNKYVDKNSYKVHISQHRKQYKEKYNKRYAKVECEVCGKQVAKSYYKYHLKMHGTAEEQSERMVLCPVCNKSFSSHYLSNHMSRMHDGKKKRKLKSGNVTDTLQNLVKPEKLSKCPVCDKMIQEDIYKTHLAKHGGPTKLYICDQCGKVFKRPSAFKMHTLTHGTELKYQCQFCPYRGLHIGLLKVHVRTHTGDYNYKCTECPARFITKSNLNRHLERHRGICKYKCDICNKGFQTKRGVDKHVKSVHLELKNHVCNICGKGFGHRDNMLSHQLKVHKRKRITDGKGRTPAYLQIEMKANEK